MRWTGRRYDGTVPAPVVAPVVGRVVARVLGRAVAPALALVLGLAGCTGDAGTTDPEPTAQPDSPAPQTPLAELDTSEVTIARVGFCALVPDEAVEQALDGPIARRSSWDNGDRIRLGGELSGRRDVTHEYGCSWSASTGAEASSWVFAPPTTVSDARSYIRALRSRRGCRTPDAPAFGRPSVATVCRSDSGTAATLAGLFVDSWLSCSLRDPGRSGPGAGRGAPRLLRRATQWCADLATTLDTGAAIAPSRP